MEIKAILQSSKSLGRNVNGRQVDTSIKELEELYTEGKNADVLNLRLATLFERLKALTLTEQSHR